MGVALYLNDHSFLIDKDNVLPALNILTDGDWPDLEYTYARERLIGILEEQGFTFEDDEEQGVQVAGFEGNVWDQEDILADLAPYVTAGSYLEWQNEEDLYWRQDFDGTTITTRNGHVAFHPVIHDWDLLVETVRDGLNADSGDAEREALAYVGQLVGLTMNDDGQYE